MLLAALLHDTMEQFTGDVPATAKWHSKQLSLALEEVEAHFEEETGLGLPPLFTEEKELLKIADLLQLLYKSADELELGNRAFEVVYRNGLGALMRVHWPTAVSTTLQQIINELNAEVNRYDIAPKL